MAILGRRRWRFWGGVLGLHFLHCMCTEAAVSALLLLSHTGRSVGRVLAAAGELASAAPVAYSRLDSATGVHVGRVPYGGVLYVGAKW